MDDEILDLTINNVVIKRLLHIQQEYSGGFFLVMDKHSFFCGVSSSGVRYLVNGTSITLFLLRTKI